MKRQAVIVLSVELEAEQHDIDNVLHTYLPAAFKRAANERGIRVKELRITDDEQYGEDEAGDWADFEDYVLGCDPIDC